MDREKGLRNTILRFLAVLTMTAVSPGCMGPACPLADTEVTISFITSGMQAKSALPDEEKISDINLLIFNSHGQLERHIYSTDGRTVFQSSLLKSEEYTFTAMVNFGMKVSVSRIEDLSGIYCHLAYPDEYREGMPMYVKPVTRVIGADGQITLNLTRLMSKISLRMDRSALSEDVTMRVTGVRIGNCPKRMQVFESSRAVSEDDCFNVGFSLDEGGCVGMNRTYIHGISESVCVYMLENMQGLFREDDIGNDSDKVFGQEDIRSQTCSYIEIDFDYTSSDWESSDGPLKYRFYLGEDRNSLDIERNCHYHITVCPRDNGISEDSWRVDKSELKYVGQVMMEQYPSDYIVGNIGDRIHIGCHLMPSDAPFDIGLDYLEFDRERGIYDYEIDEDGHGVILTLKKSGTGLIYMEAGTPIDDTALFLIEVNLPET